jgi:predicted metal-dependent hydrolase
MPWLPDAASPGESSLPALPAGETARSIELGERTVAYVLRRASRRTIGLTIDHRGLRVGAPRRASLREVESMLLQHGQWISEKLDEWSTRRAPEVLQISDGLQLPVLGRPLRIRLALGANRCLWNLQATEPTLTLCLRAPTEAARVLEKALREKARELFAERLTHYAPLLGVTLPRLSLSSARTRWGSCSLRSGIHLNWRLIHFPPTLIDYVVAHELAHLREMNHSALFWALVAEILPNYKDLRAELKKLSKSLVRF